VQVENFLRLKWLNSTTLILFLTFVFQLILSHLDAVTKSSQATACDVEASMKTWLRNPWDRDGDGKEGPELQKYLLFPLRGLIFNFQSPVFCGYCRLKLYYH